MELVVDHICKSYGKHQVLENISFKVQIGTIVGLLGRNGAGKTTLMKILAGLSRPDSGSVDLLNGQAKSLDQIKARIGYLSEQNPLYNHLYVKEYLHWRARSYNIRDWKSLTDTIIEKTNLTDVINKKISNLSKGFKQRVGLAAALIHDPDILLLDEPMNGLDPGQIIEFRTLISSVSSKKVVLFSSHILQEIKALCHRTIFLEPGKEIRDIDIASADELDNLFEMKS